jgi:transcriptional regulator with XRE-family HTH domain
MQSSELRAFRARLKLTRRRLAELLELPSPATGGQVTVARWERGEREPPSFLWRALRDVEREITKRPSR